MPNLPVGLAGEIYFWLDGETQEDAVSDWPIFDAAEIDSLGDADQSLSAQITVDSRPDSARAPDQGPLNGPKGAETLLGYGTYPPGMCLEAVSKAIGAYWRTSDNPGYYTYALRAYETTPKHRLRTTRNPPKGAIVYFSHSAWNNYGHICLSLGDGKIVSTDIPSNGRVGVTTIDGLAKAWNRKFLGWADWLMGHEVTIANAPPKPAPKPKPTAHKLHGVDVSAWQPARILRDIHEYDFAIVKATGGPSYVSDAMKHQVGDAIAKQKRIGLYHFALDGFDNAGPHAEADHFSREVKSYLPHKPLLVLDWEATATSLPVSWAAKFIRRVRERTGQTCAFYSYANYVQKTDLSEIVALGSWLWIAAYGDGSRRNFAAAPGHPKSGSWPRPHVFQFTSTGRLKNYQGDLDLNIYHGTAAEWDAYVGGKATATVPATQSSASKSVKYTVRSGDTLTGIANQFGTTVAAIQAENSRINDPDVIDVGWVLTIPTATPITMYTVRQGDNLSQIASAHGTTVSNLVKLNGISNPDLIYPGQKLRIR